MGDLTESRERWIEVWQIDLPEKLETDDVQLLSHEERNRMARFVRERDAARFAGARAAARRVLALRLGVSPADVVLGHHDCPACGSADHGPPRVVAPQTLLRISLSRSGQYALLAVAESVPVGVDHELVAPIDVDQVADSLLSPSESAYLGGLKNAARQVAFYRCWSRKEAVTKASGIGIVVDLRKVDVAPHLVSPVVVHHRVGDSPCQWIVTDLALGEGIIGAVCQPADDARPVFLRFAGPRGITAW